MVEDGRAYGAVLDIQIMARFIHFHDGDTYISTTCSGMPAPHNIDTARQLGVILREEGCTPATIAILHGRIHVGLAPTHFEQLVEAGANVSKCSRRDMAAILARKGNGGTTVSGTMVVAHRVGIDVFVTGGIGGVHRNGEQSKNV